MLPQTPWPAAGGADEILDIVGKIVKLAVIGVAAEQRHHRVEALAGILRHHVAGIVDDIGVVAGAARHRVGARAAVDDIVAAVAGEVVGKRRAGDVLEAGERVDAGAESCPAAGDRRITVTAGGRIA